MYYSTILKILKCLIRIIDYGDEYSTISLNALRGDQVIPRDYASRGLPPELYPFSDYMRTSRGYSGCYEG